MIVYNENAGGLSGWRAPVVPRACGRILDANGFGKETAATHSRSKHSGRRRIFNFEFNSVTSTTRPNKSHDCEKIMCLAFVNS